MWFRRREKPWSQNQGPDLPFWLISAFALIVVASIVALYIERQKWWNDCLDEEAANGYTQARAERRCRIRQYEMLQRQMDE